MKAYTILLITFLPVGQWLYIEGLVPGLVEWDFGSRVRSTRAMPHV
jgi:hypothetical protein